MRLFKVRIKQGRLAVMANNMYHAEAQAKALERDLTRHWTGAHRQTHVREDIYALGSAARQAVAACST